MRTNNSVIRNYYAKDGVLVTSNQEAEVRREFSIASAVNWSVANKLISEAAEDLVQAPVYAANLARKNNGNLLMEFEEGVVKVEFVDGECIPEFHIIGAEGIDDVALAI